MFCTIFAHQGVLLFLLPNQRSILVDVLDDSDLLSSLTQVARSGKTQLKELTATDVAQSPSPVNATRVEKSTHCWPSTFQISPLTGLKSSGVGFTMNPCFPSKGSSLYQ